MTGGEATCYDYTNSAEVGSREQSEMSSCSASGICAAIERCLFLGTAGQRLQIYCRTLTEVCRKNF